MLPDQVYKTILLSKTIIPLKKIETNENNSLESFGSEFSHDIFMLDLVYVSCVIIFVQGEQKLAHISFTHHWEVSLPTLPIRHRKRLWTKPSLLMQLELVLKVLMKF